MFKIFLGWFSLLALVAGCQQPSDAPADSALGSPKTVPAAPMDHMAGMNHGAASAAAPASPAQAETMRLHDALMGKMDSLMSEGQRLRQRAGGLDTSAVAGRRQAARQRRLAAALGTADERMMGWMHDFQKIDTTRFSAHQYVDYWADQQRQLRRMQGQTRAALDSARRIR